MPRPAQRTNLFSSAVFFELSALKAEQRLAGTPVIDLGIGSPDTPPPAHVRQALSDALDEPGIYGYPTTEGSTEFRRAASDFLHSRYGVSADPETEVTSLMGAQDGLAHLPLALVDPGQAVLLPNPGYPIYEVSVHLAGGIPHLLPLTEENGHLPDLRSIPDSVRRKTALLILNYPSNPLAAVAPAEFFDEAIAFARDTGAAIVHDAAYAELTYDGPPAVSFLSRPGAKEVGIELHSFSKTFNFAGARLAFAAGNREILGALRRIKSNVDYGVFSAVQRAGIAALRDDRGHIEHVRRLYRERRDALMSGLAEGGWEARKPGATMFLWTKVPTGEDSRSFTARILRKTGVACVPGVGFGSEGEGHVRIALVQPADVLYEAGLRMARAAFEPH